MTKQTDQGFAFEEEVAKLFDAQLVPGSGNTPFLKLDIHDVGKFLWSCKWTGADRFIVGPGIFDEINSAISAPGGVGGDYVGGAVIGVRDNAFLVLRLTDAYEVLNEKITIARQSKADARRELARTPVLRREDT